MKSRLGSPSEIKKLPGGEEQWIYVKNKEVGLGVVTTDVGTSYIAEYTFNAQGVLKESNYRAVPMSNPLVR